MLNAKDLELLAAKGISEKQIEEQLACFVKGFPFLEITASASVERGIVVIPQEKQATYMDAWDAYLAKNKKIVKFVPASGAASRMFKNLYEFLSADYNEPQNAFEKKFFDDIRKFAFYDALNRACIENEAKDIPALIALGQYKAVVSNLLESKGLNYGQLPKGLLLFHAYPQSDRTAMEEHVSEGAMYAKNNAGEVNIHFTVSPEHKALFEQLVAAKTGDYDVQLPQPNLGVRTNALIDTPFLMKTAETIRLGTGIPQIFNDEVVVPAFLNRGVSLEDARDYSVVGCVELSIPGRTYGLHDIAMFNLLKVMEICLHENEGNAALTYEGLLEQIRAKISHYITLMVEGSNICDIGHRDWAPVPLLSSFISDCLEKGRDITDGGARYNFSGVQGIGIANLSDSLHALKGMIFDQQRLSFDELLSVLKANFATPEGEKVRARLINRFEKYGNDIDEVDNISAELLRHYCKEVEKYQNPRGGYFTPGSYTVSAHVPLGSVVGATPDGRFAGEQLADGGLSPMLGQDAQGPTAVLKSVSKLDNTLLSNGTLLNVKFTPATLEGEAGLRKLADFLRAFTQLKLQHIQFNVVNADTLREAQQRPQDYAGLVVRVAGYSAFFVELSKEIQDDIIRRTAHQL